VPILLWELIFRFQYKASSYVQYKIPPTLYFKPKTLMITQQAFGCIRVINLCSPPSHFRLTVIYEFHHNPQLGYVEKPINYSSAQL